MLVNIGKKIIYDENALEVTVARWFLFRLKIPFWVYFGGPWNENGVNNSGHLEYFTSIWYI
jgi:hypothetical protein